MAEIDWKSKADEYTLGRPVGFLFERPADSVKAAYLAGARAGLEAAAKLSRDGIETAAGVHHSSRTISEAIRSIFPTPS